MSHTILLVEDEVVTALDLQIRLGNFGYKTLVAHSGEKALTLAAAQRPDLVLLDIRLKNKMDGITTAELMRARLGILGFIYLTAMVDEQIMERAKETNPYGYLIKPIAEIQLKITLDMALTRLEADRALRSSQAEVKAREKKYRMLFENMAQGVIYQEANGQIVDINPAALALLGLTRDEVLNHNYADLEWQFIDPAYQPLPFDQHPAVVALQSGWPVRDVELGIYNPRRQDYVWAIISAIPQFELDQAAPHQIFMTLHDITDRKQIELDLQAETRLNQVAAQLAEEILSADLSIDNITAVVRHMTMSLTNSKYSYVSSIDPITGDNILHAFSEMMPRAGEENRKPVLRKKAGGYDALWGYSLKTGKSFFTNEPALHPAAKGTPQNHLPLRNFLSVPAIANGQLLGQIAVGDSPQGYSEQDLARVTRIADIYALAILRLQFEDNLVTAKEETETLYTTLLALSAATDLPDVLRLILQDLQKVVPYDSASVQVLRGNYFEIIDGIGFEDKSQVVGIRFDTQELATEKQILETRQPLIINEVHVYGWKAFSPYDRFLGSWMGVPLLFGDRVIGKLGIDKSEPGFFTEKHAELAMAFAAQAAIAIENARFFRETEEARREAETSNQAKSQFLASMSHELRTPLNGILGYTQILQKDPTLSPAHQKAIQTIYRSGEHLLLLINDTLDLAKIEAGRMELHLTEFDLLQFLMALADTIRVRTEEKGLAFYYDFSPDLPSTAKTDERRLRQILLNLLGNAVKFTDRGHISFSVRLQAQLMPSEDVAVAALCFEIKDTGVGISDSDQNLIFDAFEQVTGVQPHADGTGLGLAITWQLVQMMDGSLKVESKPGRGSLFAVTLPLLTTVSDDAGPTSLHPNNIQIVGYQADDKRVSVLVVDDHPDNRALLSDMLIPLGFDVYEASSGQQAVQDAAQYQPDLILMDLLMPEMDGYEATRQIRQQAGLDAIPIIAVSATVSDGVAQRSMAAGCDDFLGKPFVVDDLLGAIAKHLSLEWRYQQHNETAAQPQPQTAPLVLPPLESLQTLCELAEMGDIYGIQEQIQNLRVQQEDYSVFLDKISALADQYRVDLIESFIEQLVV